MYSKSSEFRFFLKFTKNGQIDDVIKWSWRHQKKIKHSLLQPPIDDLLDMWSEDGSSFYLLEIKKLPIGILTAVEPWKKWHVQTQLFWWRNKFENISNTRLESSNNFLNIYFLIYWAINLFTCTNQALKVVTFTKITNENGQLDGVI